MITLTIVQHYLRWHYTRAINEFWHVAKNLLWFTVNFFSLTQLIRSLFSPFRRITEERGERFNFEDLAGYVLISLISRLLGFILRSIIILSGTVATIGLGLLTLLTFVFWLIAPLVLITMIGFGIQLLITPV
jgi:hypothetical protein